MSIKNGKFICPKQKFSGGIELFKTKCKLPDNSEGEVCKKVKGQNFLVCNNKNWWKCSKDWILKNKIKEK